MTDQRSGANRPRRNVNAAIIAMAAAVMLSSAPIFVWSSRSPSGKAAVAKKSAAVKPMPAAHPMRNRSRHSLGQSRAERRAGQHRYDDSQRFSGHERDPVHRMDMRLQERIPLGGRRSIDGIFELFNLFNRANYGSYVTDEASSQRQRSRCAARACRQAASAV